MARGKKASVEEQLTKVNAQITKVSEELKSLKEQKKDLEKKLKNQQLAEISEIIESNGMSMEEVRKALTKK